jgi:four helix bundle protein
MFGMRRASERHMIAKRFEDLVCWQLARELERQVYAFTATARASKDLEYCRQIRKSSSSSPRNMAEGFGRYLPGDFARFMRNALGSLNETRDHLGAGHEQSYLSEEHYGELLTLTNRAIGASVRLTEYLERSKKTWRGRTRRNSGSSDREP